MSNKKPPDSAQQAAQPSALGKLARRLRGALRWAVANPLYAVPLAAVLALPVVVLVAVQMSVGDRAPPAKPTLTAKDALSALDAKEEDRAERIANALVKGDDLSDDDRGTLLYVLGVVASHRGAELTERMALPFQVLAAKYLAQAKKLGFPPGREATGLLLLGRNLFASGQVEACRSVLRAALPLNPEHELEIHEMLGSALAQQPKPQPADALRHVERYLADKHLSTDKRVQGRLLRAQVQLELGDTAGCEETLAKIPRDSSWYDEVHLLRGRARMHQALELKGKGGSSDTTREAVSRLYEEALEELRISQGTDGAEHSTSARALFLTGVCRRELGDTEGALRQFLRTQQRHFDGPEGIAAGVEAAELLRSLGRYRQALESYREALSRLGPVEVFVNPWMTLEELRARLVHAHQELVRHKRFAEAIALAKLMTGLFPKERSLQLIAQSHGTWARNLQARAEESLPAQAVKLTELALAQHRAAGTNWNELAKLRYLTRDYPDDLWNSAQSFLAGHDFQQAAENYHKYLDAELRRRRPLALLGWGEALLALDQVTPALDALMECIEVYPRDAASFRARLLASDANVLLGKFDQAESLLLDNLNGDLLTPESREWRDSLFALGHVLYAQGRYDDSLLRLEEAVERYPDLPVTLEARYLAADACRRRAGEVRKLAEVESSLDSQLARRREVEQLLEKALANFEQAIEALGSGSSPSTLLEQDRKILRNCYFARGATLFGLARYEEAAKAYASALNHYQDVPEVLDAYVQIAACYRRLGKPEDARGTLQQAKVALRRMKSDAPFLDTTNFTREEWSRLLDSLGTL